MYPIDKIIFGDNQFFGINHMSQEKAQQLAEKFYNNSSIFKVYNMAFDCGIRAIMLNSNDRAKDICKHFISNKSKYPDLNWYPSIPYPHKYANLVSEKGIIPTINEILFKDNSAIGVLGIIAKGSSAVLSKDAIKLMKMLIDVEMKMFRGLNVKVIFLQNIITDLFLGYEIADIFYEYCKYIREKYKVLPGLITQNMPVLKTKLEEWNIEEVVICTSFNKIGYLMSPDKESYIAAAAKNDSDKYQLMAMSTLASGAIPVKEAYNFINQQNIDSVVFGASSKNHIEETVSLINIKKPKLCTY
ncbi:hypothetical protein [Draconibacterium orientale]|uniref:hypothetical protein n=1 Tax=Draconibacterium orientale TaxID=1168034 RepID=UPI002ABDC8C5|nr:hypothetical protein [Draconibacterium orientale]